MTRNVQEAREALGQRLREFRRSTGMSGRDLAARAGWHESKVSKLEYGRRPPSEADLRAYCNILGAEPELPELITTLRNIDSAHVEWRRVLSGGTKSGQNKLAKLAGQTRLMRIYQPYVIPGLLQTAEYAEAILRQAIEFYRIPDDLDEGVSQRLERQQILYRGECKFHILMRFDTAISMAPTRVPNPRTRRLQSNPSSTTSSPSCRCSTNIELSMQSPDRIL
ncbi:Scr1 family TA system antitoxin-like transcriptional regulator [Nocardia testacea]|uniref:Scr1 family TA system antitoxin-like transcriptional regulator n=1 Tax=Nocardia testacea TaxID=248551 RepID=UPI0012F6FAD6|nr:Scr1 family TA system antitoxin-like transcriptional regulator [Nocardia testacea]